MADPQAVSLSPRVAAPEDGATAATPTVTKHRFRSLATNALLVAKLKAKEKTKGGRQKIVMQMTNIRVVGTKRERLGFAFMIFVAVCTVIGSVWHTLYKYFHETISSVDFELQNEIKYPVLWACMEWSQVDSLHIEGLHDNDASRDPCPPTTDPLCNVTADRTARCIFAINKVKRVSDDSVECLYWRRGTPVTAELQRWIVQVVPPRLIEGEAEDGTFMCIAANEGGTITDYREKPLFAYLDISARDPAFDHLGWLDFFGFVDGERLHLTGYLGVGENTTRMVNDQLETRMMFKKTTMGLFNVQNVVDITMDTLRNLSADSNDYHVRGSSHQMYFRIGRQRPDHIEDWTERAQIEFKTSSFVVRTVNLRRKYLAELVAELGGIFSFVSILVAGLYVQEGVIYSRIPGRQATQDLEPLLAAAPAPAPAPVKASGWSLWGGSTPTPTPVYGDLPRGNTANLLNQVIEDTNVASHVTPVWVWRWCGEQARFAKARDFALEELPELMPEVEMSTRGNLSRGNTKDLSRDGSKDLATVAEEGKSGKLPNSWK